MDDQFALVGESPGLVRGRAPPDVGQRQSGSVPDLALAMTPVTGPSVFRQGGDEPTGLQSPLTAVATLGEKQKSWPAASRTLLRTRQQKAICHGY